MEKEQKNKVVDKESNSHCVSKLKAKCNTKLFYYSTTRWVTKLDLVVMQSRRPSHIPSSVLSDHPSSSPSVSMSVNTIHLPSITPTTLPSDVPSEKPVILVL